MIPKYKRKAYVAGAVWFLSFVAEMTMVATLAETDKLDIILGTVFIVNLLTFVYGCWAYAKAKGYSSVIGIVLPVFLSLLGFLILLVLEDKHPEAAPAADAHAASGGNPPNG